MSEPSYRGEKIIKNHWPNWMPLENGQFARHWTFEFEGCLPENTDAELSDADISVRLSRGGTPNQLLATTSTSGNAWSDAVFFTTFYRFLERLEARFGRLRSIQGQARDEWPPFRPTTNKND